MDGPILVAVNDSAAGFEAAEIAIDYARRLGESLCAVTVVEPASPELAEGIDGGAALASRREREADAILRHVVSRGAQVGITVATSKRTGPPAAEILAQATSIGAGLLVIALVDEPSHAVPYIGGQTLRVLEFSAVPVLVVPAPARGKPSSSVR